MKPSFQDRSLAKGAAINLKFYSPEKKNPTEI
jgi:hypothetical protein